jgi:hypothetical protein
VLSGDVHHAYAARADYDPSVRSVVWQLTCSPVHNFVPRVMKWAFRLAWSRAAERVTQILLDSVAKVPAQPLTWTRHAGPYYGNEIATLELAGRSARLRLERAMHTEDDRIELRQVAALPLTPDATDGQQQADQR